MGMMGMKADVAGLPQGCKGNVKTKTCCYCCASGGKEKNPSSISFESHCHVKQAVRDAATICPASCDLDL